MLCIYEQWKYARRLVLSYTEYFLCIYMIILQS